MTYLIGGSSKTEVTKTRFFFVSIHQNGEFQPLHHSEKNHQNGSEDISTANPESLIRRETNA